MRKVWVSFKSLTRTDSWYWEKHLDVRFWAERRSKTLLTVNRTRFIEWVRQLFDLQGTTRTLYYYCSRTTAEGTTNTTPVLVLRSLIRQLAWNSESSSISKAVSRRYPRLKSERPKESDLSLRECEELLLELLQELQECAPNLHIVAAIDALDECHDPDQLLEVLKSMCHGKSNIRFVISSRLGDPGDYIRDYFDHQLQILTNGDNSNNDMAYYVRMSVESQKPRLLRGKAGDLEERLIRVLIENAQGM